MTAREKFRRLFGQNHAERQRYWDAVDFRFSDEVNSKFAEKHNVVHQKCCVYCRFGVPDCDGECSCVHPDRLVLSPTGKHADLQMNTSATDTCNAFEERTPSNDDVGVEGWSLPQLKDQTPSTGVQSDTQKCCIRGMTTEKECEFLRDNGNCIGVVDPSTYPHEECLCEFLEEKQNG